MALRASLLSATASTFRLAGAVAQRRQFASSAAVGTTKLYELRTYNLIPDKFPEYLAKTGSDAFNCRLEASKLCGFFSLELGGTASSVSHFWEYDNLDHRAEVRAKLAGDPKFVTYFASIRPLLLSQHAVLTEGLEFKPELLPAEQKHLYALESFTENSLIPDVGPIEGTDGVCLGVFRESVGAVGKKHALYAAPTFESLRQSLELRHLLDTQTAQGHMREVKFMTPTAWSPMK